MLEGMEKDLQNVDLNWEYYARFGFDVGICMRCGTFYADM